MLSNHCEKKNFFFFLLLSWATTGKQNEAGAFKPLSDSLSLSLSLQFQLVCVTSQIGTPGGVVRAHAVFSSGKKGSGP